MSRRELDRLLDAIREAQSAGTRVALATVVRVHGSAYRREGTQIVVREDGSYECALSGGCLEPAVADAAQAVIASGEPALIPYDLADDSVFGLGIGCRGAVDILIERLDDSDEWRSWIGVLERGEPGVLVTALAGATGRLLVLARETRGTVSGPVGAVVEAARERLAAPSPHSGPERIDGAEFFFAVSAPPPHLLIFGAGPDAVPLARGAFDLGFAVTVVDPRTTFLTPARFPGAQLIAAHPAEVRGHVSIGRRTFAVIMNHHLERDRASVKFALESEAPYVGVLGPRSRLETLLMGLAGDGWQPDASARARLRSPIGLAIGAETPEEIAVSILGEIVAVERGFDGGFLSGRTDRLHRAPEKRAAARS